METEGQAKPAFDAIVVIGDSLSDNGNAGRFSNGPVWVEYLAERLGLPLTPSQGGGSNFAVGGALLDPRSGSTSLRAQATAYLQAPRQRGRILHVVYGGGNDLLAAVASPRPQTAVETAIASLRTILVDLAEYEATDILVPNLPGLGITPAVRTYGSLAVEAADRLRGISTRLSIKRSPDCLASARCAYTAWVFGRWPSGFAPIRQHRALSTLQVHAVIIRAATGTSSGTAFIRRRKLTGA